MRHLYSLGLRVPQSIAIDRNNAIELFRLRDEFAPSEYWYLRFNELAAPELPRTISTDDLLNLVGTAVQRHDQLSVIVQERVKAKTSGVLAVNPKFVFVEHVSHELQALLRLGVTPCRSMFSATGTLICEEVNQQEFFCYWNRDEFQRDCTLQVAAPLLPTTSAQLLDAARCVHNSAVLEWIEKEDGDVVFLDYRSMPIEFLSGKDELVEGFRSRLYRTFATEYSAGLQAGITQRDRICYFHSPLYEYKECLASSPIAILLDTGGLLAHLCVYASNRRIPCILGNLTSL